MGPLLTAVFLGLLREGHSAAQKFLPNFAGPYLAYVERPAACSIPGFNPTRLRFSHYVPARPETERQRWNGHINVTEAIDDSWWSRVIMDVNSNNAWKENAFIFNFPQAGCSNGRENLPEDLVFLFTPKKTPCRVERRVHLFENKSVLLQYPHFRVIPYGLYRFSVLFGRKNSKEPYYCFAFITRCIPRRS